MGETASAWPRLALAALVVALVGATAYIVHLRGRAADVGERAAAPQAAGDAVAMGTGVSPAQWRAMRGVLAAATGSNRKAWFQIQADNEDTAAAQAALQQVFEQAGWTTETVRKPYRLKSGIFLLAADDPPAAIVDTVHQAFASAGIDVQYLTGYRAFYLDRKRNNSNWAGPELASDQPFVIAVGSRPTPKAAQ